jgi:hypothetical protein
MWFLTIEYFYLHVKYRKSHKPDLKMDSKRKYPLKKIPCLSEGRPRTSSCHPQTPQTAFVWKVLLWPDHRASILFSESLVSSMASSRE